MQRTSLFFSYGFNKNDLLAFMLISCIAIAFGYWFTTNQLNAVSPEAIYAYPTTYFILTTFKCYCTIIAFFTFSYMLLSRFTLLTIPILCIAATYLPLLLIYSHCALYWIAAFILGLQGCLIIAFARKKDYLTLVRYLPDIAIFCTFFLLHFYLTSRFSPLHWDVAMLAGDGYYTEELPVLAPIFKGFVLAKQFAFSYIDHAQWAGVMNPPITLSSSLLQLLTFIFDLPSASYESFHTVLAAVHFIIMILGSFGFYLFLRYAAKIHILFAAFGGYLFFFSGVPLLGQMFIADGGVLLSSYAVFPYALLFISLAFEKLDYRFALWAGLALASQFFFYTPHPEGTIYSFLFFGLFSLGLVLFSKNAPLKKKIILASIAIGSFMLLSAYIFIPIVYDQFTGNMYVFAHTGDIQPTSLKDIVLYMIVLLSSLIILKLLPNRYQKIAPVYKSSIILSFSLLTLMLLTSQKAFSQLLVNVFHIGLHFWYPWRIGMYLALSSFIVFIFALDAITTFSTQRLVKKYTALSGNTPNEQ
ncbi:MAG TPA: hypothetical protein VHZ76_10405 [Gammaproteobacteria bacterium]|jgi:hypothetical protein|nr:hypothetical protein [Gammaproteobacteria bacterium]